MPLTPFHLGPTSWIGLLLFRLINFGAFLAASVIIDIEPFLVLLFNLNYNLHGFFHSYLGGTIAAILFSFVYFKLKSIINKGLNLFKIAQDSSYKVILFSCLLGVYSHVFLDSFLYTDIKPFFPFNIKPFYGLISYSVIYLFCGASFLVGGLFYLIFLCKRKR